MTELSELQWVKQCALYFNERSLSKYLKLVVSLNTNNVMG